MTALINGHAPQPPPDPREPIAKAVIEAIRAENPDAEAWDDLSAEDRESELYLAEQYITAHMGFMAMHGFRVFPPGVTPIPKSEQEALAMVQAAQRFLDSRKRKSKLISGRPQKLILPKGAKLQ